MPPAFHGQDSHAIALQAAFPRAVGGAHVARPVAPVACGDVGALFHSRLPLGENSVSGSGDDFIRRSSAFTHSRTNWVRPISLLLASFFHSRFSCVLIRSCKRSSFIFPFVLPLYFCVKENR